MEHYDQDKGKNTTAIEMIIIRSARENIPIRVMSRILGYPELKLRQYIESAVDEGKIGQAPPDDWPHLKGISQSLPSNELIFYGHHNRDVADTCAEFGLTVGESCLLMCLVKRAGQFCSTDMLLGATARNPENVGGNLIQTHICRIRKKLKPHGINLVMKRWCGYMMPVSVAQIVVSRIAARRRSIVVRAA
jgi:hypothetical protein